MPAQKVWTNKDTEKYLPPDDFIPDDFEASPAVEDDFIADEVKTTESAIPVVNQPKEKNKSFIRSVGDFLTTPLTNAPSEFIDRRADKFDKPSLNRSPMRARLEGFSAGAAQGMGDLVDEATSPLSLALSAYPYAGKVARGTINTLGKATGGVGSLMRKYQPLTGMPIISPLAGRNLQRIERAAGRGLEKVGNAMRQFGKGKVKVVDNKVVSTPEGSPFVEGESINPTKIVVDETAKKSVKSRIKEIQNLPDDLKATSKSPSLVEGTELSKLGKRKLRFNREDGTYTDLNTGEIVDSLGKPVPLLPPPPGMVRPSGSIDVKPITEPKSAVRIQNLGSNTTPFKAKNSKLEEEYYNNEIMTKGQKESVEMMPGIEESIRRERALDLQEGQSLVRSQPKGVAPDQRAKIMRGMHDPVDVFFPDANSREIFGAGQSLNMGKSSSTLSNVMQRYTDASKRVAEQYGLSEQASRSMVSQYNQYIRQLSTGQPKYGEGLSVKAPSFQEFIESKISNEPLQARSEQGGIKIGSNIKRAVGELTTGYSGQLEGIMIREAMQNALDAIRSKGNTGNIDLDLTNTGFTMTDNGNGMTLKQLETVFSDLYSSGKGTEAGATGGKGIGKATYMMGGERFEVSSVAIDNGKRYKITLNGTPDEFSENVMPVIEEVPDTVPLGTSIRTDFLPEKYGSSSSSVMFDKIIRDSRELTGTVNFERNYTGKKTKLFKDWSNDKVIAEKQIEGHDVKIAIPDDAFFSERGGLDVQVLNNGMYQYEKFLYFSGKDIPNMPNKVIVNIKPNAAEGTVEYPFPTQRESLKNSFDKELDQLINTILVQPGIDKHTINLVELYASMDELRAKNKRNMVIYDPGNRLFSDELMSLKNNSSIYEFSGVIEEFLDNILNSIGDSVLSDRLERTGIILSPDSHGIFIPNPDTGKSAILINPFINIGKLEPAQAALEAVVTILHEVAHIGKDSPYFESFSPGELNDPRIGRYLESYVKEVMDHGGLDAGHGVSFIKRLGQVYGKTPVKLSFKTADKIQSIYDPSNTGGYSGNIKEALQIYIESRRREATTEDFLSRTGVKQKSKGSGKGNVFSNTKGYADGVSGATSSTTGLKRGRTGKPIPGERGELQSFKMPHEPLPFGRSEAGDVVKDTQFTGNAEFDSMLREMKEIAYLKKMEPEDWEDLRRIGHRATRHPAAPKDFRRRYYSASADPKRRPSGLRGIPEPKTRLEGMPNKPLQNFPE